MIPQLTETPVLETERLVLRAPAPQDWDVFAAFWATERSQYQGGSRTRHDAWRNHAMLIGHWVLHGYGLFSFCHKDDDVALGVAGPFNPEGWAEAEIGWSVVQPDAEGKGYAYEAAKATRDYAFSTLGWDTAVSYIDPDNARSIALAERLGCTLDKAATLPDLPDWEGTLVYRHPAPEGAA